MSAEDISSGETPIAFPKPPAKSESYRPSLLRDISVEERPQERMERLGAASLQDRELLAMLLRSGRPGFDVLAIADHILREAGSLAGLVHFRRGDFQKVPGIGKVKSLQLEAVTEIARRVTLQKSAERPVFDAPEKVFRYFTPLVAGLEVEKFWILCLTRKNTLMRVAEITSGTASASLVHPREVFREAIRQGAVTLIAVHNHPSGDPSPSSADIQVTRQLREAAKIISIDLLDHIIVGHAQYDPRKVGFYSFHDAGLL